jgi:hypothetical protein
MCSLTYVPSNVSDTLYKFKPLVARAGSADVKRARQEHDHQEAIRHHGTGW